MDNTINNYQPNNKLYKYMLLAVLSLVSCIYYLGFRAAGTNHLEWYDWGTAGLLTSLTIYFSTNARKFTY